MSFTTFKLEKRHVVREDDATELPQSLTLFAMFGYLDDEGQQKFWSAGQVVTDPDEMRDLIARGVLFQPEPEPAADGV